MNKNTKRILQSIAQNNGVTVNQVISDMQKAIDEGLSNPDPAVQAEWAVIPRKGKKPTPEELIAYQTGRIKTTFKM